MPVSPMSSVTVTTVSSVASVSPESTSSSTSIATISTASTSWKENGHGLSDDVDFGNGNRDRAVDLDGVRSVDGVGHVVGHLDRDGDGILERDRFVDLHGVGLVDVDGVGFGHVDRVGPVDPDGHRVRNGIGNSSFHGHRDGLRDRERYLLGYDLVSTSAASAAAASFAETSSAVTEAATPVATLLVDMVAMQAPLGLSTFLFSVFCQDSSREK